LPRRYEMRKIVLAVGCMCLLAAPAWAGGGFSLFGTYGQVNDYTSSGGLGARVSFGGQRLLVDATVTWFPKRSSVIVRDGGFRISDSLQIYPVEVGLRYLFAPGEEFRPYVGAGASWFLTDLQGGSMDDELGFYALAGMVWGDGRGIEGFVEGVFRRAQADVDYGSEGRWGVDLGGFAGVAGIVIVF
jgi:hypothetical protein